MPQDTPPTRPNIPIIRHCLLILVMLLSLGAPMMAMEQTTSDKVVVLFPPWWTHAERIESSLGISSGVSLLNADRSWPTVTLAGVSRDQRRQLKSLGALWISDADAAAAGCLPATPA